VDEKAAFGSIDDHFHYGKRSALMRTAAMIPVLVATVFAVACQINVVVAAEDAVKNAAPATVVRFPGKDPGPGQARKDGDHLVLENAVLECRWMIQEGKLVWLGITDKLSPRRIDIDAGPVFRLLFASGPNRSSADFQIVGQPKSIQLEARVDASRLADRFPGVAWVVSLQSPDKKLAVTWRAELRDGANAVRQSVAFEAKETTPAVTSIVLVDVPVQKAAVVGTVPGSPVVAGNLFFAYEHPKSRSLVRDGTSGDDLALLRPVKVSGQWGNCRAAYAVDGDYTVEKYWGCQNVPVWLQVDLEDVKTIDTVRLVTWHDGKRFYQYKIETSVDGTKWQTAADETKNRQAASRDGYSHKFTPLKARYVRATITHNSESGVLGGHIVELEVYDSARAKKPSARELAKRVQCALDWGAPFTAGQAVTQASAVGVMPAGQHRRGFLYYVERERAHPYRPFLHYNSWYDVSWGDHRMHEAECVEAIEGFGRELTQKRRVALKSFVWDDGWDDFQTLWKVDRNYFPRGFEPLLAAAKRYKSTNGFWLSPWGGYGKYKAERLKYGRQQGFEIDERGFSMTGPKYSQRFQQTCLDLIRKDGANFFKFDGISAGDAPQTEAMLRLITRLRQERPDLFVSATTGTWPSPYWLWLADSTWRGGGDMGFTGKGPKREQWVTYRDAQTLKGIVRRGPLYPINSIMNQGIAHAKRGSASVLGQGHRIKVWNNDSLLAFLLSRLAANNFCDG